MGRIRDLVHDLSDLVHDLRDLVHDLSDLVHDLSDLVHVPVRIVPAHAHDNGVRKILMLLCGCEKN